MKRRRIVIEAAPIPRRKPEFVTREMLADLRDEIEIVLENARKSCEAATRSVKRQWNEQSQIEREVESMRKDVAAMRVVLGLDTGDPHPSKLGERVTWSYFHVWIARINARLDKLEERCNAEDTRTHGSNPGARDGDHGRKGQARRRARHDPNL